MEIIKDCRSSPHNFLFIRLSRGPGEKENSKNKKRTACKGGSFYLFNGVGTSQYVN